MSWTELAILSLVIGCLAYMLYTRKLSPVNAVKIFAGALASIAFLTILKRRTNPEDNSNTVVDGRDVEIGEKDDKGWIQPHNPVGDVKANGIPEGVDGKTIETKVELKPEIEAEKHEDHNSGNESTRDFIDRIKASAKVWFPLFILISLTANAENITLKKTDFDEMIRRLEILADIEEAKPVLTLSPITVLYDSEGRVYSRPDFRGSMEISTLKYNLNGTMDINAVHRRSRKRYGELFSLSVFHSHEFGWGIGAGIELNSLRPIVFAHETSFGLGLRIPVFGNAGILLGGNYPSKKPIYGVMFKL